MYKCIAGCGVTSETPTRPDRPEWGFLCSKCANEPPRGADGKPKQHWQDSLEDSDAETENSEAVFHELNGDDDL